MFLLRTSFFFLCLFALVLVAHLLHSRVLWAEEGLPLAAAMQMKRGSVLYRDIWFDKPPFVSAIYLLWGAMAGPGLRLAGALYGLLACLLAFAAACRVWSVREGYAAAFFIAFFLVFDTHSSVLPLAADLLLVVPHLAAIWLAWSKRPYWCGVAAGIGFLVNAKAVFVLAGCAVFLLSIPQLLMLMAGFASVNAVALACLWGMGALPSYIDQVWRWPAQYAGSPVVADPVRNGIVRSANWLGFHTALLLGAAVCVWRERRWQYLVWLALAYAGVALGMRFFPRYFFLLLPPLALLAARAIVTMRSRALAACMILALIVPAVRFGPRYFALQNWSDLALDRDARHAAEVISSLAPPQATLYVWGYRPEIFIYTGMKAANRYLDCQAMTGVPADRHLTQSTVVLTTGTHEARMELAASTPTIIADGLSLFNPALSMSNYSELRPWLAGYREAARTAGTIIYVRR